MVDLKISEYVTLIYSRFYLGWASYYKRIDQWKKERRLESGMLEMAKNLAGQGSADPHSDYLWSLS